jgi:hypothetical protein
MCCKKIMIKTLIFNLVHTGINFIMHAQKIGKPNKLLKISCHSLQTHIVTRYY